MINPGGGSQAWAERDTGGDTELSFQGTGSKTALSVAGEAEASEPQVLDLGQFLPLQGCSLLCEVGSAVCGDHSLCLCQRKWWSLRLSVGRLSPGVSGGPWTQSCPCLQDINDNVPIFSQLSYTFPVKERDAGKSSLGQAGRGVLEPSVASGHPQGGPEAPEGGENRGDSRWPGQGPL